MYILSSDLPDKLLKALRKELQSKYRCEMLLKYTDGDEDIEIIYDIIGDERKHYSELNNLYIILTGQKPADCKFIQPDFSSYVDGILEAISDKASLYKFYCDMNTSTKSPYIKSILSQICRDENNHLNKINYLFTRLKYNR